MTRSHKFGEKDHAGIAEGTALPVQMLPKFFGKNGHADMDPKKTKKNGGGKGNWGGAFDEAYDEGFTFTHPRRRSNSSSHTLALNELKSKFEINEQEPVFEEAIHGPDYEHDDDEVKVMDEDALHKVETASTSDSSVA